MTFTSCVKLARVVSQQNFAKAMTERRKRAGYDSQTEAADRAGVSRTLWRQMEDPERPYRPRRANVLKVARILRWDLEEALTLAGYDDPPTDGERAEMHHGTRDELDRVLARLPEHQLRVLLVVAKALLRPGVDWSHEAAAERDDAGHVGAWKTLVDMNHPAPDSAS